MICGNRFETLDGKRARVRKRHTRSPLFTIFCFSGSVYIVGVWGSTVRFLEGRGTLTLSLLNCGSIRRYVDFRYTFCYPETGKSHSLLRLLIN